MGRLILTGIPVTNKQRKILGSEKTQVYEQVMLKKWKAGKQRSAR